MLPAQHLPLNAYSLYSVFMANFVITERHIFLGNMIHRKALI